MRQSPAFLIGAAALSLAACAGSPTLYVGECPAGLGVEISGPDAVPCAPFVEVRAESNGDLYRFWGRMSAFPTNRSFDGGTVSVVETGRSIAVPASGRFSVDSLRADQTLLFSSDGYRDLERNVGLWYREIRD